MIWNEDSRPNGVELSNFGDSLGISSVSPGDKLFGLTQSALSNIRDSKKFLAISVPRKTIRFKVDDIKVAWSTFVSLCRNSQIANHAGSE
jgi:hypothetical protein